MGAKFLSLTLGEEHRLRVFEKRVLRKIFGPKSKMGRGENCLMARRGRGEVLTGFWLGGPKQETTGET
jgi:hypothetical protein